MPLKSINHETVKNRKNVDVFVELKIKLIDKFGGSTYHHYHTGINLKILSKKEKIFKRIESIQTNSRECRSIEETCRSLISIEKPLDTFEGAAN